MFGLAPMREGKSNVESGYYTFSGVTKGKKAIKYGVVKTRSNVHNWKHKFVLVSCRTWGVSTQRREVYMKPTTQMRSYLNVEKRALLATFQSEGKKHLEEWFDVVTLDNIEFYGIAKRTHPRVPKLLQKIAHLYGATANKMKKEVLGDVTASSGTPSELKDVDIPSTEGGEDMAPSPPAVEAGASSAPAVASDPAMAPSSAPEASSSPAPTVAPIRPGSPLGRIKRGRQPSPSPQAGEGSEGKSIDSSALVQKKRKRTSEKIPSGGDEEEIIDMTVGREHELPQVATDRPAQGGERDPNLSSDDENLKRFLARLDTIVVSDDEVQEVAPSHDTAEGASEKVADDETEAVASPPKQKRRLKKKAEKEADSEDLATGREIIVAPQPPVAPKEGRRTRSKKCETEKKLPSLDLPTTLLPTDHPAHTTYEPPKRSILSSDSMLLSTNGDKAERHRMRVQWGREFITEKDKDIAEHLSDVQLRQWITQASVHQQILWTESLRRQEKTDQLIKNYVEQQITYKEEGNKKIADAISRAEEAVKKEKAAVDEFERYKTQLSNMEKNFINQRNETQSFKAKAEHAAEVCQGKEYEILSLKDDVDQLKKKNEDLERKLRDVEAALAKEKEAMAAKDQDLAILRAENDKYLARWTDQ
ncbi:hypothetical protein Dimus_020257 [Dionaea muscipula]